MSIDELLELIGEYLNNGMSCEDYQYYLNLLKKRTIVFNMAVGSNLMERVILPLLDFEKDESKEPVTLFFNTPGGYLSDGLVLCDIIDKYSKPLNIIVFGYAYSMGAIMLCAGANNPNVKKYCHNFTYALFHPGSMKLDGETNSIRDTMEFNNGLEERIKNYILDHTLIPSETYEKYKDKQWYLSSEEMLEYGMVDEIL